ncbi:hypothetical protein BN946_scf185015.g107 [Trametes cinnabarina]|uniref:Urease accessory protein UreF n=1 Tax=Pycnoporus cinnabarinus TaxID=5643 RepID=A0A060SNJ5_PYCCI|nr:hypothetical protein BN946_scf185015.g107 [Trametes cinnabarina]
MDSDHEAYILLLLSDSNLPTGSFVASAGLESYVTHGFFTDLAPTAGQVTAPPPDKMVYTVNFLRDSLSSYARSALPFVLDAHVVVEDALKKPQAAPEDWLDSTLRRLVELDELYEATTLNHVARRASRNQGVALLTLFSKGFSEPQLPLHLHRPGPLAPQPEASAAKLADRLKLLVRREETHGHLPICWGVLTAALQLSSGADDSYPLFDAFSSYTQPERSQYLHLFLQARSLLSSSVRLNTIGPYAAQQLLLHAVRPVVDFEMWRCKRLTTASVTSQHSSPKTQDEDALLGPAMTWPLGEILAARHDLQHSRIFNS